MRNGSRELSYLMCFVNSACRLFDSEKFKDSYNQYRKLLDS
jgi:predicted membrane protein